jgi:hypothetical protein
VVKIGAPSRSASATTSAPASSAPPPAQITGLHDAARTSSAPLTSGGSTMTSGANSRTSQRAISPASRSVGISTKTGRRGGSSASATADAISPGSVKRCVAFVTGANRARWSEASCSAPPTTSRRLSDVGMSVAITTTGEREAHASPVAPRVLAAPGPVVTSATPTSPVARA